MKIIILKDNVKREIEGPFRLCMNREDRRWLAEVLRCPEDFYDGWFDVPEKIDFQGGVNMPPKKWTD